MVNEAEIDARAYLRLLLLRELTFEQAREDLLLSHAELSRMKKLLFDLPESAKQIEHRRRVWIRLLELLGREAAKRAATKQAVTR